jgi:hypothetical protein
MARPVRIEWPEKARIAVVLQVPFEQYERGGAHASKTHLQDLVPIPTLPEEMTAQVCRIFWQRHGRAWEQALAAHRPAGSVPRARREFSVVTVARYGDVVKAFKAAEGEKFAHTLAQDIQSYRLAVKRCARTFSNASRS